MVAMQARLTLQMAEPATRKVASRVIDASTRCDFFKGEGTMKRTIAIALFALLGANGAAFANPTVFSFVGEDTMANVTVKTERTSYAASQVWTQENPAIYSFNP